MALMTLRRSMIHLAPGARWGSYLSFPLIEPSSQVTGGTLAGAIILFLYDF